jgi:hypothetical protein
MIVPVADQAREQVGRRKNGLSSGVAAPSVT